MLPSAACFLDDTTRL